MGGRVPGTFLIGPNRGGCDAPIVSISMVAIGPNCCALGGFLSEIRRQIGYWYLLDMGHIVLLILDFLIGATLVRVTNWFDFVRDRFRGHFFLGGKW